MSPKQTIIRNLLQTAGGATIALGLFTSCDKIGGDPSYEKEVLKLTAEKAALEAKFEALEQKLKNAEAETQKAKAKTVDSGPVITKLEAKIASLEKELSEMPKAAAAGNTINYNLQAVRLGFMTGVEKLKSDLETQHPDYEINSVTLEKLQLPSSKPFSSGVSMKVVSKSTGQTIPFRWNGNGAPDGTWTFQQINTTVADNQGSTPQVAPPQQTPPSTSNNGIQVTRETGTGNNGTPSTGQTPATTPAPPKRPVRVDGNTHQVDWNNLPK